MKNLLFFFFLLSSFIMVGQNLVPNPSFELFNECPTSAGGLGVEGEEVLYIQNWYSMQWTPDYMHYCAGAGASNFPDANAWGAQAPQEGDAYVAVTTYFVNPDIREYIAVELTEPLVVGENYFVSFYASDADGGDLEYAECSTNNIGLKLLLDPSYYWLSEDDNYPLLADNSPDVNLETILSDTATWTQITGSFIADQTYTHIALGNFFEDQSTETLHPFESCNAIYYLDNICISSSSEECLIDNSIQELRSQHVKVYPNPVISEIHFTTDVKIETLSIYTMSGALLATINNPDVAVNISSFPTGMYQISLILENGYKESHWVSKL